MQLIFEEDGHFKAASLLSESDASAQVETASGKRSKIKSATILLRFASPAASEVVHAAEALVDDLDADFCGKSRAATSSVSRRWRRTITVMRRNLPRRWRC
jgi:hypothetical protein